MSNRISAFLCVCVALVLCAVALGAAPVWAKKGQKAKFQAPGAGPIQLRVSGKLVATFQEVQGGQNLISASGAGTGRNGLVKTSKLTLRNGRDINGALRTLLQGQKLGEETFRTLTVIEYNDQGQPAVTFKLKNATATKYQETTPKNPKNHSGKVKVLTLSYQQIQVSH